MTVMLSATEPHDGYLVRAHVGGKLRGYMVADAFGWAIVGRAKDRPRMVTVDRYEPWPGEPSHVVRRAALRGLVMYAAVGRTGEGGGS